MPCTAHILCKHLANGYCKYGTKCKYLHKKVDIHCKYHQIGACVWGDLCWYTHSEQLEEDSDISLAAEVKYLRVQNIKVGHRAAQLDVEKRKVQKAQKSLQFREKHVETARKKLANERRRMKAQDNKRQEEVKKLQQSLNEEKKKNKKLQEENESLNKQLKTKVTKAKVKEELQPAGIIRKLQKEVESVEKERDELAVRWHGVAADNDKLEHEMKKLKKERNYLSKKREEAEKKVGELELFDISPGFRELLCDCISEKDPYYLHIEGTGGGMQFSRMGKVTCLKSFKFNNDRKARKYANSSVILGNDDQIAFYDSGMEDEDEEEAEKKLGESGNCKESSHVNGYKTLEEAIDDGWVYEGGCFYRPEQRGPHRYKKF